MNVKHMQLVLEQPLVRILEIQDLVVLQLQMKNAFATTQEHVSIQLLTIKLLVPHLIYPLQKKNVEIMQAIIGALIKIHQVHNTIVIFINQVVSSYQQGFITIIIWIVHSIVPEMENHASREILL